jgi:hypothetical protein
VARAHQVRRHYPVAAASDSPAAPVDSYEVPDGVEVDTLIQVPHAGVTKNQSSMGFASTEKP